MPRLVLLALAAILISAQAPGALAQTSPAAEAKQRCADQMTISNAPRSKASCTTMLGLPGLTPLERWTALNQRALAEGLLGEDDASGRDYALALEAAPGDRERALTHLFRGLQALERGELRAGEGDVSRAMVLLPSVRAQGVPDAVMGGYYVCAGWFAGAEIIINNCGRVLAAKGVSPEARTTTLVMRARALALSDDMPAAEKDYAAAINMAPTPALTASIYQERGQARIRAGRKAEGEADLAKAASLSGPKTAQAPSAPKPAAAPKPVTTQPGRSDSQLLARRLKYEAWGLTCYFDHVPGLSMAMRDNAAIGWTYIITPQGRKPSLLEEFRVSHQTGLPLSARFTVRSPTLATRRIEGATLWLDGRLVARGLPTRQQRHSSGGYYDSLGVSITAQHLQALQAGGTAELAVYDAATGAEAGRWTYDIRSLRDVDRALELSKGRCA